MEKPSICNLSGKYVADIYQQGQEQSLCKQKGVRDFQLDLMKNQILLDITFTFIHSYAK